MKNLELAIHLSQNKEVLTLHLKLSSKILKMQALENQPVTELQLTLGMRVNK